MFDQIEALARHAPYLLQSRLASDHWPVVAFGMTCVIYSFVSIFIGSVWSAGHAGTVSPDERPFAFWSCILVYAATGLWLAFYI
jgi:hypothetical protein